MTGNAQSDFAQSDFDCVISHDDEVDCVSMIWRGYATSPQFREANERVLVAIKHHHTFKLMGDAREFVLIGADDQTWLATNWIPRALQAGVRKIALVMPRFYFNRVAVDSVRTRMDSEFAGNLVAIEYFETRLAARSWLSES